jgi:repressor LexA
VVEVALSYIAQVSFVPLTGIVAAGDSIEPIPQIERVEVPKSMLGPGEAFALRVKDTSMRDEGIFPGMSSWCTSKTPPETGETVIALLNGEATIKIYHHKAGVIELHPAVR